MQENNIEIAQNGLPRPKESPGDLPNISKLMCYQSLSNTVYRIENILIEKKLVLDLVIKTKFYLKTKIIINDNNTFLTIPIQNTEKMKYLIYY